ncbi:MAG: efflux RND transporter periplasmic adaptor subunit [Methylobacteriaceae bacterium]|nr:efflux RND transporter periplasmic adaptor subunit [Methylobacteriaceae bacterium]
MAFSSVHWRAVSVFLRRWRLPAALIAAAIIALFHASAAEKNAAPKPAGTYVLVARALQGCFFDTVRLSGYLVPRQEMQIPFEAEGYRITEVNVAEGDSVPTGQQLARLVRLTGEQASAAQSASAGPITLKSPVAGTVIKMSAAIGSITSPRAEPLFRIAVDGQIELEAELPGIQLYKLKAGEPAGVEVAGAAEMLGHVRRAMVEINPTTQLGRVRISLDQSASLRLGAFAKASIDATRRCGVSVPRSAIAYRTSGASVQVVQEGTVEARNVRVGLTSDKDAEILEGVKAGDLLVAYAGTSLGEGERVTPIFADEFGQTSSR